MVRYYEHTHPSAGSKTTSHTFRRKQRGYPVDIPLFPCPLAVELCRLSMRLKDVDAAGVAACELQITCLSLVLDIL